jgi:hypothetical protein
MHKNTNLYLTVLYIFYSIFLAYIQQAGDVSFEKTIICAEDKPSLAD